MDPLLYCRNKAAAEGSTGYYTLVFQPPAQRGALLALLALERELQEVVEDCSDPAVALHKLAFWREQLAGLPAGEATHPVCVALLKTGAPSEAAQRLERLLPGVAERIRVAQFSREADLDASCRATAGVLGECLAAIIAPGDATVTRDNASAAAAVERLRLLKLPRRAGRPPHSGVPSELLAQSGAVPSQVDAGGNRESLQTLRADLLERARTGLAHARSQMKDTRGLAATRLRLAMIEANSLERGGYVAHGNASRPLPIALLWGAWRTRPR